VDSKVCLACVLRVFGQGYALGKTDFDSVRGHLCSHVLCEHYSHICRMSSFPSVLAGDS
jgi:hypothetical protein